MRSIVLLLVAVPLVAQELSRDQVAGVARAVDAQRKAQQIPAVSVAVARGGRVVHAAAFGEADLENGVAATTASLFRTASIAKPLTATAVMQLAEQGKLDLDAPIRKYVPEWPEKHPPITCRQLLAHLAGVRHYMYPGEARGTRSFDDLVSTLKLFSKEPLVAKPGTKHSYTTYGFTLLGVAVERVSGRPFVPYMREHVFGPAGMTHTGQDDHFAILAGRTRGYQKLSRREWQALPEWKREQSKPGQVRNAHLHDTSMKIPGGGFLSTPSDLCRFALAMMSDKLMKRGTRDAMWTPQKAVDGTPIVYGLGWRVSAPPWPAPYGGPVISHSGGQAGTACFLTIMPAWGVAIAVMTNLRGADIRAIARDVAAALL